MARAAWTIITIGALIAITIGVFPWHKKPKRTDALPPTTETMTIESSAFAHNGVIPAAHTCDGDNVSPPLTVHGVPTAAKSLALIVDDPDAPAGTWVHWLVWNIDPRTADIPAGSVPPGAAQGMTSFGKRGYGGPCPPSGTHRYFFKLYALDTMLALTSDAGKVALEKAMEGHILDSAELIGLYRRE